MWIHQEMGSNNVTKVVLDYLNDTKMNMSPMSQSLAFTRKHFKDHAIDKRKCDENTLTVMSVGVGVVVNARKGNRDGMH